MNILRVRDKDGKWVDIPAIKGADGKDYVLTEADKEEIANLVLEKLPAYSGEMEDV
jgi:hypothetical protein